MADYRYKLDMAGALWQIVSPQALEVGECCAPFLTDAPGEDCRITFQLGRPRETGTLLRESYPIVWQEQDGFRVERTSASSSVPNTCVWLRPERPLWVEGRIYPDKAGRVRTLEQLLDASELELMLAALGGVSLHSSLVRYAGEAILFTAPSGTGKSTQAGLWEQYAGADQLNGDRSMLRKIQGVWRAYGSPFAGSSNIYRNESAPIRALVVLRQAPENTICRLPAAEAFRDLYSEMVLPRWNTAVHDRIIDLVTQLATELPVLQLDCTPDERAVRLLQNYLQEERA